MSTTIAPGLACKTLQIDSEWRNNATAIDDQEAASQSATATARGYHAFKDEAYALPNDSTEHDRLDIQDQTWRLTLHGGLHIAPVPSNISHAVDIGTGTGQWATEFARAYPSCQVLGTDLSPVPRSDNTPDNVNFIISNANESWDFSGGDGGVQQGQQMDFIHSRMLTLGIQDWKNYFQQAYENLKPGGWVEVQETRFPVEYAGDAHGSSRDSSNSNSNNSNDREKEDKATKSEEAKRDSPLYRFSNLIVEATQKAGINVQASDHFRAILEEIGFINIHIEEINWAVGPWPQNPRDKEIGRLTYINVRDFFLTALASRLFTTVLNWSDEQVDRLVEEVKLDIAHSDRCWYWKFRLCCAQKGE